MLQAITRTIIVALALLLIDAPAYASDRRGAIQDLRIAKGNNSIAEAWFADPVKRYRHFVLGSEYEPETLVVRSRSGTEQRLTLAAHAVFEDRQPRIAPLGEDGRDMVVVVRSSLQSGASLVAIDLVEGRLSIVAETPPTGRPNTWINPAGIADFNGDGRLDIAYVQMPHVLGRLRIVTLREGRLVEIATTENVSNHRIGSPRLDLSAVADFNGDGVADLAIPSLGRRSIRILSIRGGVREIGNYPLTAPADGSIIIAKTDAKGRPSTLMVHLEGGGRQNIDLTPLR